MRFERSPAREDTVMIWRATWRSYVAGAGGAKTATDWTKRSSTTMPWMSYLFLSWEGKQAGSREGYDIKRSSDTYRQQSAAQQQQKGRIFTLHNTDEDRGQPKKRAATSQIIRRGCMKSKLTSIDWAGTAAQSTSANTAETTWIFIVFFVVLQ